jgi:uncharacterized damage-inducible protein DinB
MTADDLGHLFAYNAWANARLFDAAASLSEEQLDREAASSFPSVRKTFAHIAGAEWLWLQRVKGFNPAAMPTWAEQGDLATLRAELDEVERERAALLESLDDAAVLRRLPYRRLNGEEGEGRLADLLIHVVNHSSYHRGQITTLIRQAGGTPVGTDLLLFDQTKR